MLFFKKIFFVYFFFNFFKDYFFDELLSYKNNSKLIHRVSVVIKKNFFLFVLLQPRYLIFAMKTENLSFLCFVAFCHYYTIEVFLHKINFFANLWKVGKHNQIISIFLIERNLYLYFNCCKKSLVIFLIKLLYILAVKKLFTVGRFPNFVSQGTRLCQFVVISFFILNNDDNFATCENHVYTITGCNLCGRIDRFKCIGKYMKNDLITPSFKNFYFPSYDKGLTNTLLSICKCGSRYVCNYNSSDCTNYRKKFQLKNVRSNKQRDNIFFGIRLSCIQNLRSHYTTLKKKLEKFSNKHCNCDVFL
ncbi:hypothetical protein RFI_02214 [Reticulomyxa filosa]|uniref:Uncharacterized protein n=1 Tax=Reticulomyxa filosa TaxID=46433 RepID=X6P9U7_RETFI|nr:hypothetical protein RFI_02214 [Reticulomyxa filosa]|eukprot:ETO34873.1 hypothetical protein RFI_02214 [Reticulomyxa filosa]